MLHSTWLIQNILKNNWVYLGNWLTGKRINNIEQDYDILFPEDFKDVLYNFTPQWPWFIDWNNNEEIQRHLNLPFEWILFNIEYNNLRLESRWQKLYGEKLQTFILSFPKLIPIYSHRYLPSGIQKNMPILSIMQGDIILYGNNLVEYFENEFTDIHHEIKEKTRIPFRSDLINW